ncbi:hypothetical protein D3C73_1033940 [compost metagenome]
MSVIAQHLISSLIASSPLTLLRIPIRCRPVPFKIKAPLPDKPLASSAPALKVSFSAKVIRNSLLEISLRTLLLKVLYSFFDTDWNPVKWTGLSILNVVDAKIIGKVLSGSLKFAFMTTQSSCLQEPTISIISIFENGLLNAGCCSITISCSLTSWSLSPYIQW